MIDVITESESEFGEWEFLTFHSSGKCRLRSDTLTIKVQLAYDQRVSIPKPLEIQFCRCVYDVPLSSVSLSPD